VHFEILGNVTGGPLSREAKSFGRKLDGKHLVRIRVGKMVQISEPPSAWTSDWSEPSVLWFALVGKPSAGKTPAVRSVTAVTSALEREAEPAWREDLARYERDAEAAAAKKEVWKSEVRNAAKQNAALRPAARNRIPPEASQASRFRRKLHFTVD
jgi:hypothetical protein